LTSEWKLLVKNRKQTCWIRDFVVGWWSTVGAQGWGAWEYHLWKIHHSDRHREMKMISHIKPMRKLEINQSIGWRRVNVRFGVLTLIKTAPPAAKPQGVIGPLNYIYRCPHTYMYKLICTYIYIYTHTHIYIHKHIYTHLYTYTHIHTHTHINVYIYTYTYIDRHTYIHIYTYI